MRQLSGQLNGYSLTVFEVENSGEFREGARLLPPLENSSCILFQFPYKQTLGFENSGVSEDLKVLCFTELFAGVGIVSEILDLYANSPSPVYSSIPFSAALEITSSLADKLHVEVGSIFTLDSK